MRRPRLDIGPGGVIFLLANVSPRSEPSRKRVVAFVDGQNLFYAAKDAFGCTWPNYRFPDLAEAVSTAKGWDLVETRFYTGIPDEQRSKRLYDFWTRRLLVMRNRGVTVYSRRLVYRDKPVKLPDGRLDVVKKGEEKGIDVRIAIDVVRLGFQAAYDVALLFSRDQDLSELCQEIRNIARDQSRWIKIASAYPWSEIRPDVRGIRNSDWIPIDRATYDACADSEEHRPTKG
ncbi:MAG: NYN domain-containing protein [Acidobacteria bacterium]|nr:NYN domain-containing protein [Acidobacteriota bacterium]